jgi:peptide/nickel transport system substrate-binding protein
MQANLAEVGITLIMDIPDTAQFIDASFSGDYDIVMVGDMPATRTPATVMPFLQKLNVDGPGMVIGGTKWTSDEIDAAITEMIKEPELDKVKEMAANLDGLVKADTICSNLYPELMATVYSKDLKGYSRIERGYIDVTALYR